VSPNDTNWVSTNLLYFDNIGQEEVLYVSARVTTASTRPVIVLRILFYSPRKPLQRLLGQHPRLQIEHFSLLTLRTQSR